jgi:predicted alpha/beta hydrolase family esterase
MKNKKVFLVHGWGGNSRGDWFPWIEKELKKKGVKVMAFDMPETGHPKIEKWVGYLQQNINPEEIDENTYFIGHSIGCQTIIRYLERLHKHKKIAGCVFVAGFFDLMGLEQEEIKIAHPWMTSRIDYGRVLDHCNRFLCIFSDNDPYVHLDEAEKFKDRLGAKVLIAKKRGHFNEIQESVVLREALKFMKAK